MMDAKLRLGIKMKKRQTRARANGFTLMELLIVISIMLILMLIAIPNFRSMTMTANELSAKNSLQAIYKAEIQYQTAFPANGFTCSLAALGGDRKAGPPTPTSAQVLEGDLATTGVKSGYTFALTNCSKQTVGNTDRYDSFTVTAVPLSVGKTGHAGFCIDEYADIKSDPTGGTNCTQAVQ
jgi:type IV pilus assembly protein PilA